MVLGKSITACDIWYLGHDTLLKPATTLKTSLSLENFLGDPFTGPGQRRQ